MVEEMSRTHNISKVLGNVMDMWHLQHTDLLQVLYSKFNIDIFLYISMLIFCLEMSLFFLCYF